ncbi:dharma [Hippoglossus hippoglossus]|uniref:dharma n=1 Tax=Hippoglossus hippoglossus TaxID=8267 RepID=UPI00148B6287|nr:dharma [Hippoglossus hippoglossus]
MEGSTVSDFSIERILSPQLGRRPPVKDFSPDRFLQGVAAGGLCPGPGGLCPGPGGLCPVTGGLCPGPASGCLQFGGMSFGDTFYYGSGFSRFYPNSGVLVHFSSSESGVDAQPLPGYHGHPHSSVPAQPPPRQKARMRTVFTDTQTKHLEALFETSDYPAVEARAGVARSTGLSEETIRVWFKNRRARRKRQRSGSKVKSP